MRPEQRLQLEREARGEWHDRLNAVEAAIGEVPLNWRALADAWHDLPVVWSLMRKQGMCQKDAPEITDWLRAQVGAAIERGAGGDEEDRVRSIFGGALPVLRNSVEPAKEPLVHAPMRSRVTPRLILSPAKTSVRPVEDEEPEWRYMEDFFLDIEAVTLTIEKARRSEMRALALNELHRLKGSASTVRLGALAEGIHRCESVIMRLPDPHLFETVIEYIQTIRTIRLALQTKRMTDYRQLALGLAVEAILDSPAVPRPLELRPAAVQRIHPTPKPGEGDSKVQVPMRELDVIAETIFGQSAAIERILGLVDTAKTVQEIRAEFAKMRGVSSALLEYRADASSGGEDEHRPAGVDPLALSRFSPIDTCRVVLSEATDGLETHVRSLSDRMRDIQLEVQRNMTGWKAARERVTALRTVQWETVAQRLLAAIQVAAAQEHKTVTGTIENPLVRLDRKVMDVMAPGLELIVRNAVAHGIESERPAHKPRAGQIRLTARQAGSGRVEIVVADDGLGIDMQRLIEKAVRHGVDAPEGGWDAESPATLELVLDLLLERGFSVRETASLMSGRGEGLKYANDVVKQLGGRMEIWSKGGVGCAFTLVLPVSLDVTTILPVRAGTGAFGIPIDAIENGPQEEVLLPCDNVPAWGGGGLPLPRITYRGVERPVLPLDGALGLPRKFGRGSMLIGMADSDLVLAVSKIEGAPMELVVRSMDPLLAGGPFVSMGTASDGSPLFVLDVWALAKALRDQRLPFPTSTLAQGAAAARCRVLIADDAVVVRQNLAEHVEQMGHEAVTVSDGLKAWNLFESAPHDFAVIVTDLEMPHLNGIELIRRVRASSVRPDIPILVVTSRTARSHQEQVRQAGGNMLLSKPCSRDTFVFQLNRWVPTAERPHGYTYNL